MTPVGPRHEPRPELFDPLLARFRLKTRERWLATLLVWLVRVPGSGRLLALWHARRTRS